MYDHVNTVWLVGAGGMARDYARVLDAQKQTFDVVGRGSTSAATFTEKTGRAVHGGGLAEFVKANQPASHAIVAVGVGELADVTRALIAKGVKNILVEKPGGLTRSDVGAVAEDARRAGARVIVGYNRRFYASTRRAREIIAEDGGVTSFNFEFTEWSHEIEGLPQPTPVKHNWLLANSTHVIDLAFFLGGEPTKLDAHVAGELSWHPSGAVFAGSGVSDKGALFSYQANWAAPGRWGVEVLTRKRRLIFRPMEKLQVMKIASVAINEEPIDDALDKEFKPGLYRQVEAFFANNDTDLLDIAGQHAACRHYDAIGGLR